MLTRISGAFFGAYLGEPPVLAFGVSAAVGLCPSGLLRGRSSAAVPFGKRRHVRCYALRGRLKPFLSLRYVVKGRSLNLEGFKNLLGFLNG